MTKRRRKKHKPLEIVATVRNADTMLNAGKDLVVMLQTLELSEARLARWRKQYGGMKCEEAKRLRQLKDENNRLKRLIADLSFDNQMLKHLTEGKRVSPSRRRAAVVVLRRNFGVSERRACKIVGQLQSSQRINGKPREDEGPRVKRMLELARALPRFGYRRIGRLLKREGWRAG